MVKYPDAAAAAATLGNWRPLNVPVARETRAEEERRNHLRGGTVYRFRLSSLQDDRVQLSPTSGAVSADGHGDGSVSFSSFAAANVCWAPMTKATGPCRSLGYC